jgi:uncharacterized RDD family membrane protein YckC
MSQAKPIAAFDHDVATGAAFAGVLRRRVAAFVLDYIVLASLIAVAAVVVALLGVLTFGLGWLLYAILAPVIVLPYIAFTLGGAKQATPGMQAAGIRLVADNGKPIDPLLAIVHSVLFWAFNSVLTPLVLLVSLFTNRKRTLHDVLLGTSVVRTAP